VKLNVESKKQPKQLGGVGQTRLEDRGSFTGRGWDYVSPRRRVQTASGPQRVPGGGGGFPGCKSAVALT
jgi:hypothetical protein